jgi:hypothetical protein
MSKTNFFNIQFFIFLAFAVEVLTGCGNTEGTMEIKGKVLDENTKTGIPRKNIFVQGLVRTEEQYDSIEAGQFSTDSLGCFTYSLMKVKDAHFYNFSMAGDSDYRFINRTLGLPELEQNAKYLSFSLSRLVNLTIKLFRKSITPGCDTLRLIWESDGVFGGSLYPYKIQNYGRANNSFGLTPEYDLIWIGGKVNSTITTKVLEDKKTELTWELYRNGRRKIFTDTITCRRGFANIVKFTY